VRDIYLGSRVAPPTSVTQQKTPRPVQFEITEQTRDSLEVWMKLQDLCLPTFCSPGGFMRRIIYLRASDLPRDLQTEANWR
jgi:hypothetical protein